MRIIHYYARYFSHPSGVVDSINNWVEQSHRTGSDVQIWAAPPGDNQAHAAVRPEARAITHLGRSRETWLPIGLLWLLRPSDVLYLHEGWTISNLAGALAGRLRGCTVVVMPHGVYEHGITDRIRDFLQLRAAAERLTLRLASYVHVFYDRERQVVSEFLGRVPNFLVFANGAPTGPAVTPWTGSGDYFLWLGRFDVEHKGLDNLLRFWAVLPAPRPKLRLAGPEYNGGREHVRALAGQLGLAADVSIESHVSGAAKSELMSRCRAYLHPSRWESCSIVLLEFLAAGTPCLVSDTIHSAIELGPAGVLQACDFAHPTASAASQAITDVDRNKELGGRARAWVGEFGSWDRVGWEYCSWLLQAQMAQSCRGESAHPQASNAGEPMINSGRHPALSRSAVHEERDV